MTTLLNIADLARPASVAAALTELALPRLQPAWRYLHEWRELERARVPAKFRRELLNADLVGEADQDSEALTRMRAWSRAGSLGMLILLGDVGVGKSYVAARWLLEQHRSGRSIAWTSVVTIGKLGYDKARAEQAKDPSSYTYELVRAEQARSSTAGACVLDDYGAGNSTTDYMVSAVNEILLARIEAGLPTAVMLNADRKVAASLLDRRVLDRLKESPAAGRLHVLTDKKSRRREPDAEDLPDKHGRTRAYYRARQLVTTFGVADRATGRWYNDESDERTPGHDPVFGDRLRMALTTRADWREEAERARELIRVSAEQVARLAQELDQQHFPEDTMNDAAELLTRLRQQHDERSGWTSAERVLEPRRRELDPETAAILSRRAPKVERLALAHLGYRVQINAFNRWDLRRVETESAKQALRDDHRRAQRDQEPWERKRAKQGTLLATDLESEAQAWDYANKLTFGVEAGTQEAELADRWTAYEELCQRIGLRSRESAG